MYFVSVFERQSTVLARNDVTLNKCRYVDVMEVNNDIFTLKIQEKHEINIGKVVKYQSFT